MPIAEAKDLPFKWKYFSQKIILWALRWYCLFAWTYRDLVRMLEERGILICHTTIRRWAHEYAVEFKKRIQKFLKTSNDPYKLEGKRHYLYRALDPEESTLDWMLSENRSEKAIKTFFRQVLSHDHCLDPRVISVDKHASYPSAFKTIKDEGLPSKPGELRQINYLNNIIEQDHRFSKRCIRYRSWVQTFETAEATMTGYKSMHLIRKGPIKGVRKKNIIAQKTFINTDKLKFALLLKWALQFLTRQNRHYPKAIGSMQASQKVKMPAQAKLQISICLCIDKLFGITA